MHIERLPAGVTANSVGEVELRGFPGPINVVELSGIPMTAESDTSDLWTRTPFI